MGFLKDVLALHALFYIRFPGLSTPNLIFYVFFEKSACKIHPKRQGFGPASLDKLYRKMYKRCMSKGVHFGTEPSVLQ